MGWFRARKTHDYTNRKWGHDYIFRPINGGMGGSMDGWGFGICRKDFLLLQNGAKSTRYRVDSISYYSDPPDMWSAEVSFAPRRRNELEKEL